MPNRIPRIFHFVFGLRPQTTPFDLLFYICLKSCLEVNKPDKIMFHYQHEPWGEWWDRIKPDLELRHIEPNSFMQAYQYQNTELNSLRYAHLSDFTRMEALLEFGGVYADMDTLFINPLPDSFFNESFVMGEEMPEHTADGKKKAEGSLCNAWMMGEAGAPFLKLWLDRMEGSFDGTWNNHSTLLPYRLSQQHPEMIHVEPQRSFFHLSHTPRDLQRIFLENETDLTGVYSLHLWSHIWQNHLWWNRQLFAPQFLHGSMITVGYVLNANTTYANVARQFLPADVKASPLEYWREHLAFNLTSFPAYFSARLRSKMQRNTLAKSH